jgi:hypothetical protein
MIVRRFVRHHHEEYGFDGWRPQWIPHFDPSEGLGVAHDTLEHVLHDQGTVETEFMALGTIAWLRGQGGWFQQHRPHSSDLAYQMSGDFMQQAEYLDGENRQMKKAPRTRALAEGYMDDALQECVRKGMKLIRDEHGEDEDAFMVTAIDPDSALSYMRMGYRRAARRYAGTDPCEMSYIFDEIMQGAEKHGKHAELGDVLVVRVEVDRCRVTLDAEQPVD